MGLVTLAATLFDLVGNIVLSKVKKPYSMLYYVIEDMDWSIRLDGENISINLNNKKNLKMKVTSLYKGIDNQIVHFGSFNTLPVSKDLFKIKRNNKIILTWFHVVPNDPRIKFIKEAQKYVDVVHTSCAITKEKLIEIGIPEEKIVVIPLGVDLNLFKPISLNENQKIREKIGIPKDKIVIGSFQKDGVGWKNGLEPKLIKGPDIFIRVIEELKQDHNIFVLLTGPSRGYVKKELERIGVPYKHFYLKNYFEIPKYYNALDLYLVTSRVEGGPKAIVESMASGVPIVSTKVGMATDVIKDGYNGFLAEIDDVAMLSKKAMTIMEDKNLASQLRDNASETIQDYSYEKIVTNYYEKIYKAFLTSKG